MPLTHEQWQSTWRTLGLPCPDAQWFDAIIEHYSQPHRHYHTLQHLEECFEKWEELRAESHHPGEVELALWFHDLIYDVRRHDNEERSAAQATTCLQEAGATEETARRVHALIMATRQHDAKADVDTTILVDVDLSILAAPAARFQEYERQIRAEYQYVPQPLFKQERKKILQAFLHRPRIFNTDRFFQRYEQAARENIEQALQGE
ncbi:hypothetical protein Hrubri_3939 [Herbaspirillum rubrisubalbicans M1]|uniref:HD domain-containing protein n=1 Tax=Herbaspirillum rubrisubalbicans TaxID=80842 RepID=UPI00073A3E22|nr:hypothetical protein [Herbaspirillum rubrisubalbicans]ALU91089.1 hypothetical protein Hrubri_3939 [Herbaspirillum rubrisubalbicans M1]